MKNNKNYKFIYKIFCFIIAIILLTSCKSVSPAIEFEPDTDYSQGESLIERLVAENGRLAMYINELTTEVTVMDKSTGEKWRTNPPDAANDTVAAGENADKLLSTLSLEYIDKNDKINYMNNYTSCIKDGQYKLSYSDNAVTVTYTMGKVNDRLLLPDVVSEQRMKNKILAKLQSEEDKNALMKVYKLYSLDGMTSQVQRDTYLEKYPGINEMNIYVLNSKLAKFMLTRSEEILKDIGYSYEQIDEGYDEIGYTYENTQPPVFVIPVKYSLTEDGLKFECLNSDIRYNTNEYILTNINVLEYFSACESNDKGYMLFPEGSGGIISLNKKSSEGFPFTRPVYGKNISSKTTTALEAKPVMLPVFGMNDGYKGFVAVIEDGAAVASITAEVSGRISVYNNIYASFRRRAFDAYSLDMQKGAQIMVVEASPVLSDYSIRYFLLSNGQNDYSNMAAVYRSYLTNTGAIERSKARGSVPLFLNILGSITKNETILTVQFKKTVPLTTFNQAKEIVEQFRATGINNITIKYTGCLNGGLNGRVISKANIESVIGGKSGIQELNSYLESNGMRLYPDANITISKDLGIFDGFFPSVDALTTIDGQTAALQNIDLALGIPELYYEKYYALTQKKQFDVAKSLAESFSKLKVSGVSLQNFSEYLFSNYKPSSHQDRQSTLEKRSEIAALFLKEKMDLLISRADAYLFPYITSSIEIPMPSDASGEISEEIPFVQLVLHGYKQYSTVPLNDVGYDRRKMVLKAIETASSPYYIFMYEDNSILKNTEFNYLYSVNYNTWIEEAMEDYLRINDAVGQFSGKEMIEHKRLHKGVYKTVFEGGKAVYVNYNHEAITIDNIRINAMDYVVY